MDITVVDDALDKLKALKNDLQFYLNSAEWKYADALTPYINRLNNILATLKDLNISEVEDAQPFRFHNTEFSHSGKTVRDAGYNRLDNSIGYAIERTQKAFQRLKHANEAAQVKPHQMRRCFKIAGYTAGCLLRPEIVHNQIFVGMPFAAKHQASYDYGIKIILESNGYVPWRADEERMTADIMCKICGALQRCRSAIFNISDNNANVMLELGIAMGLGKPFLLIVDGESEAISDLLGLEYIRYQHPGDLQQKLRDALDRL